MPPAARITDMHLCPLVTGVVPHVGGPILPVGCPTVLIGMLPAARVGDKLICVGPPDTIVKGSPSVRIGNMPAARVGDMTAHGGSIVVGFPTVIIGGSGSGIAGKAILASQKVNFSGAIQNGHPAQEATIKKAHADAMDMIANAIKELKSAEKAHSAMAEKYFGIKGTSKDDLAKLAKLRKNFEKMESEMKGINYEAEQEPIQPGTKKYTVAYVYVPFGLRGVGDVHICFPAFNLGTDRERASTVVHEMSHYSVGTDDHAYDWENSEWNGMSQEQQMSNADNYGNFAMDVTPP